MIFTDRTVLIAGMARSGASSARLLHELGAHLLLHDAKTIEELSEETRKEIEELPYENWMGRDAAEALGRADMVIVSPGLPPTMPLLMKARERGIPVIAEIELGYQNAKADIVAITGTNGKTTTTALTGEIFAHAGWPTLVLGNIGVPLTERVLEAEPGSVIVVETAALQLDDTIDYRPKACAVLNITPDHLDRYGTMEKYTAAKAKIFRNQAAEDWCILNWDDPIVRGLASAVPSQILWFSLEPRKEDGIYLDGDEVIRMHDGRRTSLLPASEVRIPGRHNLQNAMAAAALALCQGADPEKVAETLRAFPGVEHRIETVLEKDGVVYINDSKGTNPDATRKAIDAMTRPTVLLLGGFDKHADFTELMNTMGPPVRHIVVLGETAGKIEEAAEAAGWASRERAASFDEAVLAAKRAARPGDAVLLSPACASWDMFPNFEERGKRFKEIVRTL